MTNQEAKQDAIKKAYGDKWELVKDHARDFDGSVLTFPFLMDEGHEDDGFFYNQLGFNRNELNTYIGGDMEPSRWRPLILDDIEDNNGWIRIEPDGSNLPKSGEYRWLFESGSMSNFYYEPGDIMSTKLTHYKPMKPELKPIY